MRILLLANQPERTTRLLMFKATLERQGHEVIVPKFSTRDWLQIARETRQILLKEKPDVVHLFNVPDIVFHGIGKSEGLRLSKADLRLSISLGSGACR